MKNLMFQKQFYPAEIYTLVYKGLSSFIYQRPKLYDLLYHFCESILCQLDARYSSYEWVNTVHLAEN